MLEKIHASDMDKTVSRVLDILASVADITEPRNYIFDKVESIGNYTFKPRKKKRLDLNNRKFKTNWLKVSFYGMFISLLALVILLGVVSRQHYKVTSFWSPLGMLFAFFLGVMGIAEISIAVSFALRLIKDMESRKESARKIIKQADEDAIAYRPVVDEICTIVKGQPQALKTAESIIKNLIIEASQTREKIFLTFYQS